MHLLGRGDHISEEPDDGVTLCGRNTDDLFHEARVEEQSVPAGDWVRANEWVFSGDRVPAHWSA